MSEAAVLRTPREPVARRRVQVRTVGLLALLVLAPVVLARLTGIEVVWYRIVATGVCYAMMVLSLNLLMGYAGQISLGHAGLITAGAYASGLLTSRAGLSFAVGLIGAALAGGLIALLIGLPALRLRGLLLAVTTLGFLVVMQDSILPIRWLSGGSAGVTASRPTFGPISLQHNADYLAFLLLLLLGFWVLDRNVTATRLGRSFLGIREDEQVAASYGIDVARTKLVAFVLSGAMAGVAGAAFGHLQGGANASTFGLQFSLSLVAWVIIGGLGSRAGVVSAGVLFGVFPAIFDQIFKWDLITEFSLTVGALLFLVTVAINPNGFVGSIKEKRAEEAAKKAKRKLAEGGVEVEDAALPSLPVPPPRHGAPQPGAPVLEVADVTVRFGGLTAVADASITVNAGEIVGLIGPNGAGKTTLFDAIGGFNRPVSGSFRLAGRELAGLDPHERALAGLGRTFQRTGLAMSLSVRDNLLLAKHALLDYDALLALGRTPRVRAAENAIAVRIDEIIAALGFEPFAELPAKHLSGGQRRILEMACTLATAPDLLMLDEPTAGMAPAAVENLAERLRELRDDHRRTILLIEHHVPLVLDVCDRIYVLDHGIVIAEGTPDEILRDPVVLEAYLGERAARQAGLLDGEVVPA
jgi:ABC-type branched-subunit amino acid transport system ATPase component/ABC-type branched-subunit amino acid transport system permease subunit